MTPNHETNKYTCWKFYNDQHVNIVLERKNELDYQIVKVLDRNILDDFHMESMARINSLGWMTGLVLNDFREDNIDIKRIWNSFGHVVQSVLNIEMMEQN